MTISSLRAPQYSQFPGSSILPPEVQRALDASLGAMLLTMLERSGFAFGGMGPLAGNLPVAGALPLPNLGAAMASRNGPGTGLVGTPQWLEALRGLAGGIPGEAQLGGAAEYLGGWGGFGQALAGLRAELSEATRLEMAARGIPGQQTPASYPAAPGSAFVNGLPQDARDLARALNVSGDKDVRRINQAADGLKTATAKVRPAVAGDQGGAGKLVLTAEEVERIRNAPTQEAAKAEVAKAIARQTGVDVSALDINDKKGIKNARARDAVNKLLGTRIKNGQEKNSGSSMILDAIMDSTARSIRQGSAGATTYAFTSQRDDIISKDGTRTVDNPGEPTTVDLGDYRDPATRVGELGSTLIFDLSGMGLKGRGGRFARVDLDGDGRQEVISDLDDGQALLVFDSRISDGHSAAGAARDWFGDGSDLSAYGITGPREDGGFADGFQALRALCEHFDRVRPGKQHLDTADLAFLEQQVGLRLRLDGVTGTHDRRLSELGITRVGLGDPAKVQPLQAAQEDAYGNRLMKQEGATFTVKGQVREYADIWFNVQAREARPVEIKAPRPVVTGRRLALVRA